MNPAEPLSPPYARACWCGDPRQFAYSKEYNVCRSCGMSAFKSMTLTKLFLGWWGLISFIMTPIILIMNIVAWSSLRALPAGDESGIQSG